MPDKTVGDLGLVTPASGMKIPVESADGTSNGYVTPAGLSPLYNVRLYGAVGNGVTNDAAAIDAAVTALKAAGGGVLYFPAGNYIYSGAGIVNNPASGVTQHMFISGDGRGATIVNFTAASNAQCVLLDNQNAVGSGRNDGSGVSDVTLIFPAGKPGLVVADLENWRVSAAFLYGGTVGLTVSESRKGTVSDVVINAFSVDGLKIIGETHAANTYLNVTISGAGGSTGCGVRFDRATAVVDNGGLVMENVRVNAANVGFQFTVVSQYDAFMFLRGCVVDGDLAGDGFKFTNLINVTMVDCWSVVQGTNKSAVALDNCDYVMMLGGSFYAGGAGTAADLYLANSCNNFTLIGARLTGPTMAVRVDATTHGADVRPATRASGVSDATKLNPGLPDGTYTPTTVHVTNVAASTPFAWQWLRQGNTVTASGQISIQATAAATVEMGFSLPIASNFASQTQLCGTGVVASGSNQPVMIYADPTNNRAELSYVAADTGSRSVFLHLTYLIV